MANPDDDTRFGHLLKPIRDLALNWDIDIANALVGGDSNTTPPPPSPFTCQAPQPPGISQALSQATVGSLSGTSCGSYVARKELSCFWPS